MGERCSIRGTGYSLGGSLAFPYLIRLSPFLVANSGSPYNITAPDDLNGDSIFNDRPGLVSRTTCPNGPPVGSIYCTPLGTFDAAGAVGVPLLPINYAAGPTHVTLNLRLTKTFGLGRKIKGNNVQAQGGPGGPGGAGGGARGGGGPRGPLFGGGPGGMSGPSTDRRYNLTLGVNVRNVFNKVNLANPSGILGSSFFDVPNGLQGGPFSTSGAVRRIDLQATFSF